MALALKKGVLVVNCGRKGHVIRLIPPLTIERDVLFSGVDTLIEVFNSVR